MSIGQTIKRERKKMGWTQEELAKKLQITRVTMGRYERDEQLLSFSVFLKLLDIFSLSADTLLGRKKQENMNDLELRFLKYLRQEEYLYRRVMNYPKLEIEKLKNLY